ncbi:MAG: type II toxin-antitoxin system prevent-host-death family antitoxin [Rhizomicrobium sp.]
MKLRRKIPVQSNVWPISVAKANFAAFLRAAERRPQIVTVRGIKRAEIHLLASYARSRRKASRGKET